MDYQKLLDAARFSPMRISYSDAWVGHIPFAAWLVEQVKPSIFVELGTYSGNSYLAFCQTIRQTNLQTRCYAIDTWQGDEHSGFYGEEIYASLRPYHDAQYSDFSRLMRMTFDEAAPYFANGSIDLLHIDGLHTYEAVRHDFETWLPKLSPNAVVIFHDTNVRERGFGIWKYWSELCQHYALNFEFFHSNGLGVLQLAESESEPHLEWLHQAYEQRDLIKQYFAALGLKTIELYQKQEAENQVGSLRSQAEQLNAEVQAIQAQLADKIKTNDALLAEWSKQGELANLQSMEREQQIAAANTQLAEQADQMQALQAQLYERDQKENLLRQQLTALKSELGSLQDHLNQREQILQNLNSTLLEIYSSTAWKIVKGMWKVRLWLAPKGSWQEYVLRKLFRKIITLSKALLQGRNHQPPMAYSKSELANEKENEKPGLDIEVALNRSRALEKCIQYIDMQTDGLKPITHMIILPFLLTGGAEYVAMNFCKAVIATNPAAHVLLIVADRDKVAKDVIVPKDITIIRLQEFTDNENYQSKQDLLYDLIVALQPDTVHNINSEVGWNLVISKGMELQRISNLYGSIFSIQYDSDQRPGGYAANFLTKALPYLTAVLSDNRRFFEDVEREFNLSSKLREKFFTVYNPSRCLQPENVIVAKDRIKNISHRIQSRNVLESVWAGRADAEKQIDLFYDLVKITRFANFDMFGTVVVDDNVIQIPQVPNFRYHGGFDDINKIFSAKDYDALIFTSKWEGMPNILLEAGAWGIPIIAPAVGGVGELVTSETGYLLKRDATSSDYLKALQSIKRNPEEAARKAWNMLEIIQEKHSWNTFLSGVQEIPGYFVKSTERSLFSADEI